MLQHCLIHSVTSIPYFTPTFIMILSVFSLFCSIQMYRKKHQGWKPLASASLIALLFFTGGLTSHYTLKPQNIKNNEVTLDIIVYNTLPLPQWYPGYKYYRITLRNNLEEVVLDEAVSQSTGLAGARLLKPWSSIVVASFTLKTNETGDYRVYLLMDRPLREVKLQHPILLGGM